MAPEAAQFHTNDFEALGVSPEIEGVVDALGHRFLWPADGENQDIVITIQNGGHAELKHPLAQITIRRYQLLNASEMLYLKLSDVIVTQRGHMTLPSTSMVRESHHTGIFPDS